MKEILSPVLATIFSFALPVLAGPASAAVHGQAEHVVIVVWDGMRPDFVSREYTPTLWGLVQQGTWFNHHHSVYISSTEVNGTTLNTGVFPQHSGIFANHQYNGEIRSHRPFDTEDLESVRRGDSLTGGHYIAVPTLAEIIQRAGFRTVVAGTKSVALLLDRANERMGEAALQSVDFFNGKVLPTSAMAALVAATSFFGPPVPQRKSLPTAVPNWRPLRRPPCARCA